MLKINIYQVKSGKRGSSALPKAFEDLNLYLLAQAKRVYEDRLHPGTSKVKSRGEVAGSTAKIWRQKGTGRARHGSVKAPIFVGGGVAHGPKGVKRILSLTKNIRRKALELALGLKAKEGNLVGVDKLVSIKKTKDAAKFLDLIIKKELKGKRPNKITLVVSEENRKVVRFFRNLENLKVVPFGSLNAYEVISGGLVLIEKDAILGFSGGKGPEDKRTKKILTLSKETHKTGKSLKTKIKKVSTKEKKTQKGKTFKSKNKN